MVHYLQPTPNAIINDPDPIDIHKLEPSVKAKPMIESMKRGESGNTSFSSLRTISRGILEYEGIEARLVDADYSWTKVPGTNFSLCVVIGKNDQQSRLKPGQQALSKSGVFYYHRLDLNGQSTQKCRQYERYATKEKSMVMLSPHTFDKPYEYLYKTETQATVLGYSNYLNGIHSQQTENELKLKENVKSSVQATYKAEEFWTKNPDQSQFVIWRYLGTRDGHVRVYPAVEIRKDYDPFMRPWWRRTLAQKGKYVVISPYVDNWGAGIVVTQCKAIYEGRADGQHSVDNIVDVVQCIDYPYPYFSRMFLNNYPECTNPEYSCMVIDISGFLVIYPSFSYVVDEPDIERKHLGVKERKIMDDLLNNNIIERESCLDIENKQQLFSYRVQLSDTDDPVDKLSKTGYKIAPVLNSNVYIIIKKNDLISGTCCQNSKTSPLEYTCTNSGSDCCLCHKIVPYDTCQEKTTSGETYHACSARLPDSNVKVPSELDKIKELGLTPCFDAGCNARDEKNCYQVAGCSWCVQNENGSQFSEHERCCNIIETCPFGKVKSKKKTQCLASSIPISSEQTDEIPIIAGSAGGAAAVIMIILIIIIVVVVSKRNKKDDKKATYLTVVTDNPGFSSAGENRSESESSINYLRGEDEGSHQGNQYIGMQSSDDGSCTAQLGDNPKKPGAFSAGSKYRRLFRYSGMALILYLALVFQLSVRVVTEDINSLTGLKFSQELKVIEEKGICAPSLQKYYDTLLYDRSKDTAAIISQNMAEKLKETFKILTDQLKELKQVIAEEYRNFAHTDTGVFPECCKVGGIYNPKFRTKILENEACISKSLTSNQFPSEGIKTKMGENYSLNPNMLWQYFAGSDGTFLIYPAHSQSKKCDSYDPRFKHYYVASVTNKPKDVVVAVDVSEVTGTKRSNYNAHSLLFVAREAVQNVINTLSPNDRIGLVAFSDKVSTPALCNGTKLAWATTENKHALNSFTNLWTTDKHPHYDQGIRTAFSFFDSNAMKTTGNERDSVILFLAADDNAGNDPVDVIKAENEARNNSVMILTYSFGRGLSNHSKGLLSDMSKQVKNDRSFGSVKEGIYHDHDLKNDSLLRIVMASYYKDLFCTNLGNDPIFSLPYVDERSNKTALITSLCLPVDNFGLTVGVTCTDVLLDELLTDNTNFKQGELSYAFMIDGQGRVMVHYLQPKPNDPDPIDIRQLEQSPDAKSMIESMKRGETGSKTFSYTRTISRGVLEYDGIETRVVEADYSWRKDDVKSSVQATYMAEEFWKQNQDQSQFVKWRYLATRDGHLRVYPAIEISQDYDPFTRNWWRKTVAQKGKNVVISPYIDNWGAGFVVSQCKAIFEGRANGLHCADDIVDVVVCTDYSCEYFSNMFLQSYPLCQKRPDRCMVIDTSGFLVIYDSFGNLQDQKFTRKHLGENKEHIMEDLLKDGNIVKESCLIIEDKMQMVSYRASTK
ncbi:uncharacterized protein LOC134252343 [Saccostrea cucullata]|uniref:uncharacterized protein LOC134252343 n=1 Tax=Saccostrea cuccullata TaxID=36930 RepID=UPI002ED4B25E